MSDLVFTEFSTFELSEYTDEHSTEKAQKRSKILKIVLSLLAVFVVLEGIIYAFVIPIFNKPKINCNTTSSLTNEQIYHSLGNEKNSTWINFNTASAAASLSGISCVESVVVEKQFPDKINIKITERQSVAKTIAFVDGRCVPMLIDKNGFMFSSDAQLLKDDNSIPLISGIPEECIVEGFRLPPKYRSLMEQVSYISSLPQKYFLAVSEIQICPKEYGNFELVLYPVNTQIKVLTDRSLNEDALKYMMVVLDVVSNLEGNISEVDLRYGAVSYRRK